MDRTQRLVELEEQFGTPQSIAVSECVDPLKVREVSRLQAVQAVNDIRTLNDPAWNAALPYVRRLLLAL